MRFVANVRFAMEGVEDRAQGSGPDVGGFVRFEDCMAVAVYRPEGACFLLGVSKPAWCFFRALPPIPSPQKFPVLAGFQPVTRFAELNLILRSSLQKTTTAAVPRANCVGDFVIMYGEQGVAMSNIMSHSLRCAGRVF